MPLSMHKNAMPAALAALAARDQGKFWEYHDKLFSNQRKLTRDDFIRYAKELKLDVPRFVRDLDSAKSKASIQADIAEAGRLGVTGTPGFFVNGRFINGAKPFATFAQLINGELEKMGRTVPAAARNPS